MRQPTQVEEQLAIERVMELARMGLAGGIAVFSDGLERVTRCGKPWGGWVADLEDEDEIRMRIPDPRLCDSDDELIEACRHEVTEGIFDRDHRCRVTIANLHLDIGDDEAALQLVGGIEDLTERRGWEERLTGSAV